jgi:hypothetical protein
MVADHDEALCRKENYGDGSHSRSGAGQRVPKGYPKVAQHFQCWVAERLMYPSAGGTADPRAANDSVAPSGLTRIDSRWPPSRGGVSAIAEAAGSLELWRQPTAPRQFLVPDP